MKPMKLPPVTLGMDVLSREGELPEGAVRTAENVVLTDRGGFARRPTQVLRGALEGAHSLWRSKSGLALCAANTELYVVALGSPTTYTEIFTGLPLEEPVSYTDAGSEVYFATPSVLGKITASGLVRRPGVASLTGTKPSLLETIGGLYPGRYGVAYALVNDLGEESGLSSIASIELANGGGIAVSNIATASHVIKLNVYVTAANGTELYLNQSVLWTAATSIRDQSLGRMATKVGCEPMPPGQIVRFFNSRLYVATGKFVYVSEPFDRGVFDVKGGWIATAKRITLLEPVRDGVFVGDTERVVFYRGTGPGNFSMQMASAQPPISISLTAPPEWFSPELVPDRTSPVAAWLSAGGLVIGRADGSVAMPQVLRVKLATDALGWGAFVASAGISQAMFPVAGMTAGEDEPTDSL